MRDHTTETSTNVVNFEIRWIHICFEKHIMIYVITLGNIYVFCRILLTIRKRLDRNHIFYRQYQGENVSAETDYVTCIRQRMNECYNIRIQNTRTVRAMPKKENNILKSINVVFIQTSYS